MGKSQGKGQGKYFACHDQYFSCTIKKKSKKILITIKNYSVIIVCQRLSQGKSYVFQPIFLENGMFSATKSQGKSGKIKMKFRLNPAVWCHSKSIRRAGNGGYSLRFDRFLPFRVPIFYCIPYVLTISSTLYHLVSCVYNNMCLHVYDNVYR